MEEIKKIKKILKVMSSADITILILDCVHELKKKCVIEFTDYMVIKDKIRLK